MRRISLSDWRTLVPVLLAAACASGCVERTVKIRTEPPGALAIVNDEEVGVTPVTFSFLWYGDYELVFRKPGYETLKTSYRIDAPWYQYPGVDLVAETMLPMMIRDEHAPPAFVLAPASQPTTAEVTERALELRERALYEGD